MASALLDPRNTHFILVCESTVPLFDFAFTYEYFTSEPRGFLMNWPNTGHHWKKNLLPLILRSEWVKGDSWFALRQLPRPHSSGRYRILPSLQAPRPQQRVRRTLLPDAPVEKDPQGLIAHTPMNVRWTQGPIFFIRGPHPVRYESWDITPGPVAGLSGPYCAPGNPRRWRCYLFARQVPAYRP